MAAMAGHTPAQYQLGLRLLNGGNGVDVDLKQAISWLERAAQTPNNGTSDEYAIKSRAQAAYALGHCYETGRGVTISFLFMCVCVCVCVCVCRFAVYAFARACRIGKMCRYHKTLFVQFICTPRVLRLAILGLRFCFKKTPVYST